MGCRRRASKDPVAAFSGLVTWTSLIAMPAGYRQLTTVLATDIMTNDLIRVPSLLLAVALLSAPAAALAQVPSRVGNIWNWHDHQPTETQVREEEKAAGILPNPSQEASDAATLNQINRQLLH
jgi:hypothetical protein